MVTECTQYERPARFSYHNGRPVEVDLTISVTPTPTGTPLKSLFDAGAHGLFRLIFPIFLVILRRQEKANMANVKRFLEDGASVAR